MAKTAIVQLGKIGDVINILPLCEHLTKEEGEPVILCVGKEFANHFTDVPYIQLVEHNGLFTDVPGALKTVKRIHNGRIIVSQVYGIGVRRSIQTDSFCKDAWVAAGYGKSYGLPLNLPRRPERAPNVTLTGRPIILVASESQSSPFPMKHHLRNVLNDNFGQHCDIIELGDIKVERFTDLLGLYDRAAALVSTDTGHLHLANACPNLPVFALVTHVPTLWHGSPERPNHVFRCRYDEFPSRMNEMVYLLGRTLGVKGHDAIPDTNGDIAFTEMTDRPRIHHVWSGPSKMAGDTLRRHDMARATWAREAAGYGNWVEHRIFEDTLKRNATSIGDAAPLPFIHDLVESVNDAKPDDIILLTNSDIGFVRGFAQDIMANVTQFGCVWSHRWDFKHMPVLLDSKAAVQSGRWYPGCDTFAFTKRWWDENKDKFPDMILARECWDWVMMELMKESNGVEIHAATYHELHDSFWKQRHNRLNNRGNMHNRGHARQFLTARRIPLKEIEFAPFTPPSSRVVVNDYRAQLPAMDTPKTGPMDIVIALGTGSKWENNELRYCLRGIERHVVDLGRVYVIGHNPGFLSDKVTYIPLQDPENSKEHNITYAIQMACEIPGLSQEFVFFNDDHFLIGEFQLNGYPYYQRGTLEDGIKTVLPFAEGYKRSLQATLSVLKASGKPTMSYEVHVPIRYDKTKFRQLDVWWERSAHTPPGFVARSIYVNVLGLPGGPVYPDCKLRGQLIQTKQDVEEHVAGLNVFSIDDSAVRPVAQYLSEMYPDKSQFEL